MSQWKIREDLILEICMDDVEFQEKYENAFEKLGQKEKALQKVGKVSEISKAYCKMFYELFDDIFGPGVGNKIFEGKQNVTLCESMYDSFIEHASEEVRRINEERSKRLAKYKPIRK